MTADEGEIVDDAGDTADRKDNNGKDFWWLACLYEAFVPSTVHYAAALSRTEPAADEDVAGNCGDHGACVDEAAGDMLLQTMGRRMRRWWR